MPTVAQRATAICDAILNTTATAQQKQRAQAAFGSAENFLREVRRFVISKIEQAEEEAGKQATRAQVRNDFSEAP